MATTAGDFTNYNISDNTFNTTTDGTDGTNGQWITPPQMNLGVAGQATYTYTASNVPVMPKITMNTGKRIPGGIVCQAILEGYLDSIFYCYVFGSNHILINKIDKEGQSSIVCNEAVEIVNMSVDEQHEKIVTLLSNYFHANATQPVIETPMTVPFEQLIFKQFGAENKNTTTWNDQGEWLTNKVILSDKTSYKSFSNM